MNCLHSQESVCAYSPIRKSGPNIVLRVEITMFIKGEHNIERTLRSHFSPLFALRHYTQIILTDSHLLYHHISLNKDEYALFITHILEGTILQSVDSHQTLFLYIQYFFKVIHQLSACFETVGGFCTDRLLSLPNF